jgi:Hydantoinase/oxoprolinase
MSGHNYRPNSKWAAKPLHHWGRGSGYPVRTPVIDLVELGAGGGGEAWIDTGGALRVGPVAPEQRRDQRVMGRGAQRQRSLMPISSSVVSTQNFFSEERSPSTWRPVETP